MIYKIVWLGEASDDDLSFQTVERRDLDAAIRTATEVLLQCHIRPELNATVAKAQGFHVQAWSTSFR